MTSKITGGPTESLFTAKLLNKYDVRFYRCKATGFIQTEEPYWLPESYSSAITKLDVGLVMRNENLVALTAPLLWRYFNHEGTFLDYAGGYGLFTRMMRDRGFDFVHTDPYCQNIFAEYHDLAGLPATTKFEGVTAFEVFEHLAQPVAEIEAIARFSENLFFTTELLPPNVTKNWWYFSLETGQHVSFYTKEALQSIAGKLGRRYYTDGKWRHLLTVKELPENPFERMNRKEREPFFVRKMRKYLRRYDAKKNPLPHKESLLEKDVEKAKEQLASASR